jgi:flagellar protein FliS
MTNAHDAYLESRILAADPVELVRILYRTAMDQVREARVHLANGDIAARSRAISKALAALLELSSSLNHETGGDLSRRLAELYDYMQQRLIQANFEQAEEPLNETAGLLATLLEAWQSVKSSAPLNLEETDAACWQKLGPEAAHGHATQDWSA